MKDLLEVDLYPPIRDFLVTQGYEVRGEVRHCDVTAVKDDLLLVVELKRGLTVDLLAQAVERQRMADMVYMAIPKPKKLLFTPKWRELSHLIRRLELGLLLVTFPAGGIPYVEEAIAAAPFDRVRSQQLHKRKRVKAFAEFAGRQGGDLNKGGSTRKKLITAYREQVMYIACCLEKFGQASTKELREAGSNPKKTAEILRKNYYGWFDPVEKGIYRLNDHGRTELSQYPELAGYCRGRLEAKIAEADDGNKQP